MTAPTRADVEGGSRAFMQASHGLPTLFDLENNAYWLLSLLEEVDEPEAADITNQLAMIDQMLMEKTEGYVSVIRSLEAMADARKAEADRLKARSATAQRHADWLRDRLLQHLKATGRERVETARFTISRRQNPPAVQVLDAALVPSEFQRTVITTSVDKRAVLDALKRDGVVVPGTEVTQSERLAIQ